jgi:hypothetical protein
MENNITLFFRPEVDEEYVKPVTIKKLFIMIGLGEIFDGLFGIFAMLWE